MYGRLSAVAVLFLFTFSFAFAEESTVRIGLYNIKELSREKLTKVDGSGAGIHEQVRAAATIIQRHNPDILVINEIDHDCSVSPTHTGELFLNNYLKTGESPIDYPYIYAAPCNTGILSGKDLNNDGVVATKEHEGKREHGDDSFGYGIYPGQYAMMLYSRFPIDAENARTFQNFLWKDMPGNLIPEGYYDDDEVEVFRLSSKSHWDVPVNVNGTTLHLLMSHPTPQGFDKEEDKNGRRNFDEVRFWAEYINGAEFIYDDAGNHGGLADGATFVILGDQNTGTGLTNQSKFDGVSADELLLKHPKVQDTTSKLTSRGARERFGDNPEVLQYTFAFWGGSRIDYILPSKDIGVVEGGVFFPASWEDEAGRRLADVASDHLFLWLNVSMPESK